ncbi:MAG: toll/interleukin-1 receptor domain-containing protein [Anaerolineae bacterium]|nr:toll/interleukin-1 receptor domain-containing protein [Anaerolineae bacterium]
MNNHAEYYTDDDEVIEAYCVRCKETIEIENPIAVWTRRGIPATRGECPICAGTVFRMGRTALHSGEARPAAVQVASNTRTKLAQDTAYVNFAEGDSAIAEQLADDLRKAGIATWLHEESSDVHWAGGVHPALTECSRMVYVLSAESLNSESVTAAWSFFRSKGKRIIIAQLMPLDPPDAIRRSPRFDLSHDYKSAFRQMVQALSQ